MKIAKEEIFGPVMQLMQVRGVQTCFNLANLSFILQQLFLILCSLTIIYQKFDAIEEAIRRANFTDCGLAAGVCSTNLAKAMGIAKLLAEGMVWIKQC